MFKPLMRASYLIFIWILDAKLIKLTILSVSNFKLKVKRLGCLEEVRVAYRKVCSLNSAKKRI